MPAPDNFLDAQVGESFPSWLERGSAAGRGCGPGRAGYAVWRPFRGKVAKAVPVCRLEAVPGRSSASEEARQSVVAADMSTQTTPSLPSWSAITVNEGESLSSTTVPPAARAAAIRCWAASGAT